MSLLTSGGLLFKTKGRLYSTYVHMLYALWFKRENWPIKKEFVVRLKRNDARLIKWNSAQKILSHLNLLNEKSIPKVNMMKSSEINVGLNVSKEFHNDWCYVDLSVSFIYVFSPLHLIKLYLKNWIILICFN